MEKASRLYTKEIRVIKVIILIMPAGSYDHFDRLDPLLVLS
jgi:hypothetical protein